MLRSNSHSVVIASANKDLSLEEIRNIESLLDKGILSLGAHANRLVAGDVLVLDDVHYCIVERRIAINSSSELKASDGDVVFVLEVV